MQSNVINFAERVKARSESAPDRRSVCIATDIEIMVNDVRETVKSLCSTISDLSGFGMVNGGDMHPDTVRLTLMAGGQLCKAMDLLMAGVNSLDAAAINEQRGGDNLLEIELPDFPDLPA